MKRKITGNRLVVVYAAISPSGRVYVGQARDFIARKRSHLSAAKGGYHCNPLFARALLKYGKAIEWRIIGLAFGADAANEAEESLMREWNALAPVGYNLMAGATVAERSPETRAKISAGKMGWRHSAKSKALLAAAGRKRKASAATRRKMRLAKLGKNNPNYKHGRTTPRPRK